MTHFYERNIVEIKNIYTNFLINVIAPLIHEGFIKLYSDAEKSEIELIEKAKTDPAVKNIGILKLFQLHLAGIPNLNENQIENETNRIRTHSKCADWFNELIQAVIKSNIVLLTYNASGKTCKIVQDKYHESISINLFIHKCYIECAKIFINYPELFYKEYSNLEVQRNKREIRELIKNGIGEAIKKMLPIKLILQEYLSNDYIKEIDENISENISNSQFMNLKNLVNRDLHTNNSLNSFNNPNHQPDHQHDDQLDNQSKIIDTTENNLIIEENKKFEKELDEATSHLENKKDIKKEEPDKYVYVDIPDDGKKNNFLAQVVKEVHKKDEKLSDDITHVSDVSSTSYQDKQPTNHKQSHNSGSNADSSTSDEDSINVVRSVKGSDINKFYSH